MQQGPRLGGHRAQLHLRGRRAGSGSGDPGRRAGDAAGTGGEARKEAGEGGPVPGAEGVGAAPRAPETLQPHRAAPPPQGSSLRGELRAPRPQSQPWGPSRSESCRRPRVSCAVRGRHALGAGTGWGLVPPDPRWPRDCPGPDAYPRPLRLGTWSQLSSRSHTLLGTLAGRPGHFRK